MEPVEPGRRGRGWFGTRRQSGNSTDTTDATDTSSATPSDAPDPPPPLEGTEHSMIQSPPGSETVPTPGSQDDGRPGSDANRAGASTKPEPTAVEAAESSRLSAEVDASETGDPPEASGPISGEAIEADTAPDPEPDLEPEPDQPIIPPDLPRILAIANQKGGVGKTTTSVNLGASLAEMGFRVLVVDLDPQGNATTGLGVNAREVEGSIYDVIMSDAAVEDCIEPTSLKNLFVVPATIDLAGAEIELVPAFSRELKLRRALNEIKDDYDYILIDCPPSLGLLTVNGLAAADDVLVPIQCEYYALEGLSQLIRNVSLVRTNLNPTLDVRGIVLTMYDARTKLADQVEQEVRRHFGRTVYLTVIPRTVRLSEAPSFGQPIILFDPTSRGAVAYRELAKEVSNGATRRTG